MTLEEAKKRMNFEMETGIYTQYDHSYYVFEITSYMNLRLLTNFFHRIGYRFAQHSTEHKGFNVVIINTISKEYGFDKATEKTKEKPEPFPEYLYDVEEIQGIL